MRTWPGPGAPTSTSSMPSTSGPPWRWKRNALLTARAPSTAARSTEGFGKSGRDRLEVELQRLHHARVHIVTADEDGQFHDLPGIEMALHRGEDVVRHRDVARHRIGIGEGGALALGEEFRRSPVRERIAFLAREPLGGR